ncbi:MAG: cytochrome c4 [Steroidobacteraceae bacterium]|jgi:cytochrome c553|nr:cytochrome c4 [Steroidobacteraceae bacterium]
MRKNLAPLAILALAAALPAAHAQGSADAGAAKAGVCIACHGPNGNSTNPEWPNLAGQNAAYIAEQLRLFRAGQRSSTPNAMVMTAQAAALSDEDIADLGAYFATQTPSGLEADPSYWKAGEALYRGGDQARELPACMACHGPVGRGNPAAAYPALRAQHSVYTAQQLTEYANAARYKDAAGASHDPKNAHMMETIAKQLTAEDIRNLASYIQGMR